MEASRDWTPEAWNAALEAMRSRLSVDELLALHEAGAVSVLEVLGAVWGYCHDKPVVAGKLLQILQQCRSEDARYVARLLEDLLRAR